MTYFCCLTGSITIQKQFIMDTLKISTDILKTAILLERRGKAFYTQVARQSDSKSVKKIFEMMAEEEEAHITFLSTQFLHYEKTHEFLPVENPHDVDETDAVMILSENIKKEISAAGFEAAAISAAIDFENRAIEVYSKRAVESTDTNEKGMYQMLADWEKSHHKLLYQLNEDLKEQVWNDNNFWPF